jgi:hypothetical protein
VPKEQLVHKAQLELLATQVLKEQLALKVFKVFKA